MSSQPPEARAPKPSAPKPSETGAASAGPETKWPRWRVTMLVGAVVLLAVTIADAAIEDFPSGLYGAAFFIGYMFLAYGFFLAMNARREAAEKKNRNE